MIPNYVPKHARTQYALDEKRDHNDTTCPGMHCLGRAQSRVEHRHTAWAVHFLNDARWVTG